MDLAILQEVVEQICMVEELHFSPLSKPSFKRLLTYHDLLDLQLQEEKLPRMLETFLEKSTTKIIGSQCKDALSTELLHIIFVNNVIKIYIIYSYMYSVIGCVTSAFLYCAYTVHI